MCFVFTYNLKYGFCNIINKFCIDTIYVAFPYSIDSFYFLAKLLVYIDYFPVFAWIFILTKTII